MVIGLVMVLYFFGGVCFFWLVVVQFTVRIADDRA